MTPAALPDDADVLADGPWRHRFVSAGGTRFHVAELGEGPLVLLMHGFPQYWYAWRHQLLALAEAGFRAAAMDLRGYGASDKPPRGYATYAGAADAARVVHALGEQEAVVVGHDLGGFIAWSMPSLQPGVARAVASFAMPHPRVIRRASFLDHHQRAASAYVLGLQVPFRPEREMTRGIDYVSELLHDWAAPGGDFPRPQDVRRYAAAMALPFVAHSASEHYRWFGRSQLRQDGPLFNKRVKAPVTVPVLQVLGSQDGCVVASAVVGRSARYAAGPFQEVIVEGAGHFLPEEAPERVSGLLVEWLRGLPGR